MPRSKIVMQVPFGSPDTTVAAATEAALDDLSPVTGTVKSITLHFPDGCNALVEIVCYLKGMQILPLSGRKIALNNSTNDFEINRQITRGDKIRVVISNKDSVNSHTPSIIFNIEGGYDGSS